MITGKNNSNWCLIYPKTVKNEHAHLYSNWLIMELIGSFYPRRVYHFSLIGPRVSSKARHYVAPPKALGPPYTTLLEPNSGVQHTDFWDHFHSFTHTRARGWSSNLCSAHFPLFSSAGKITFRKKMCSLLFKHNIKCSTLRRVAAAG